MKSILSAIQEGRMVELPTGDKDKALEYLAVLIEAIPDIGTAVDLVGEVKKREVQANTGLGEGIACPHVRTAAEGELLCAIGWSPEGIDYGSYDGKKVYLVIMFLIPDNQKNTYLKELSGLAIAVKEAGDISFLSTMKDLSSARSQMLDWVELAIDKSVPIAKARMIKLEEKTSVTAALSHIPEIIMNGTPLAVYPFSAVVSGEGKCIVLGDNDELTALLEKADNPEKLFNYGQNFELNGYYVSILTQRKYGGSRLLAECVALKPANR